MTIQQISHFIAVAQHLHFGEAAKELYIAQPALSNSIAALEGEIAAVKAEQAISLSLISMGMSPLVIFPVTKEMSSESLLTPPCSTKSSR